MSSIHTSKQTSFLIIKLLDFDAFKPPPIRVTQESLHILPHSTHSGGGILSKLQQSQQLSSKSFTFLQRRNDDDTLHDSSFILCINQSLPPTIFTNNSEEIGQNNQELKKILKQSVLGIASSNGRYVCYVKQEGDIVIYDTKEDTIKGQIKGVQKFENQQKIELRINNQASIIVIRVECQEYAWIWVKTRQLEQNFDQKQIRENPKLSEQKSNNGLFRSSSFDKRFKDNSSEKEVKQGESKSIQGTWNRIPLKEQGRSQIQKESIIDDYLDIQFTQNEADQTTQIQLLMAKLYSKQSYFGTYLQEPQHSNDEMIIELSYQNIPLKSVSKGGVLIDNNQYFNNLKQKISCVEFSPGQLKSNVVLTKLDNSGSLSFTVLNSTHMLYCQGMFTNFETSLSLSFKLFNFVTPDDSPSFDNRGKTSLCIDDAAWTNNDAFIILLFNSLTFAVLPRLGNSLISIYNPTFLNISPKLQDLYQHYKKPRAFNELVLPYEVQQKQPQIKQQILSCRKTVTMHPTEESFIITDGQRICQTFKIEYEPELTELFGKGNMSYYFVRFCISLERLAVDKDILEKIPQLLTNKLPLFEFDKNVENDEEEEPGQVIMTASQINPFEHGFKRMETYQSFNAEFNLECQVVLMNLKHLLMSMRWNKSAPINYFQWIVTVVNDCFFYFLKNSEPLYAYHALRIGEAYCKKYLFTTETDREEECFEKRDQEFQSERADYTDFNQLKRYFDVVHNMYDYHNTKDYMSKTTAEKLEISYNFFGRMPCRLTQGSGNWRFQFTKNYSLLVFYSLIQFRNYQAANFNIIFLVFACYIMQRYLDTMFNYHIQKIIKIVFRNYQLKKKSDDYELFLGKQGKNTLLGEQDKIKSFQDWSSLVLKYNLSHIASLFEQDNFENLMDTLINKLSGNQDKVMKNLGYLNQFAGAIITVNLLDQFYNGKIDFKGVLTHIRNLNAEKMKTTDIQVQKSLDFNIGMSLFILTETIARHDIEKKPSMINMLDFLTCIMNLSKQTFPYASTNFISQLSETLNPYFLPVQAHQAQPFYQQLGLASIQGLKEILAITYLSICELHKAIELLDPTPSQNEILSPDHSILFRTCVISTCIKQSLKQLESITATYPNLEAKHLQSKHLIDIFQQKANCIQTIRKYLSYIKYMKFTDCNTVLWAQYLILPSPIVNITKEEVIHQSVKNLGKIMKYIKQVGNEFPQFQETQQKEDQSNQITDEIFNETDLIMIKNEKVKEMFKVNCERVIVSIYNQQSEGGCIIQYNDEVKQILMQENGNMSDSTRNISALIIKSFKKFAKVYMYLKHCTYHNELLQCAPADLLKHQLDTLHSLFVLSLFTKFTNSQQLITQGLILLTDHFLTSLIQSQEDQIINSLNMLSYQDLNRVNKQKLAQILEIIKQSQHLVKLTQHLENMMFGGTITVSQETIFERLLIQSEKELLQKIFNSQAVKSIRQQSQLKVKECKLRIIERSVQVQDLFGISMDQTYFYDRTQFCQRAGQILGLNDGILQKYRKMKQKREKIKSKAQFHQEQEPPLSFREHEEKKVENKVKREGISLETVRHFKQLIESPRPQTLDKIQEKSNLPIPEIQKGLMKNRQLGNPSSPRQVDLEDIQRVISKLATSKTVEIKNPQYQKSDMLLNQHIEPVSHSETALQIFKLTDARRKNSVKRTLHDTASNQQKHIGLPSHSTETQAIKLQHRKGQQSMAAPFLGSTSFNFGLVSKQNFVQKHPTTSIHPPGLPKPVPSARKHQTQPPQSDQYKQIENYPPFNLLLIAKNSGTVKDVRPLISAQVQSSNEHQAFQLVKQSQMKKQKQKEQKQIMMVSQIQMPINQIQKKFKVLQQKLEKVQKEVNQLNRDINQM